MQGQQDDVGGAGNFCRAAGAIGIDEFSKIPAFQIEVQFAGEADHHPPADFHRVFTGRKILAQDQNLTVFWRFRQAGGFKDARGAHGKILRGIHVCTTNEQRDIFLSLRVTPSPRPVPAGCQIKVVHHLFAGVEIRISGK